MGITLFLKMIDKIKTIEFYLLLSLLSIWSIYFYDIACWIYSLTTVLLILYFKDTAPKIPTFLGGFSYKDRGVMDLVYQV